MEQSQLIELVRTLNAAEKEQILQFARIPFINNGKMKAFVPMLLEICFDHSWQNLEITLDKKTVFSSLFPDQSFAEGKLDKIMAEAHKVVKTTLLVSHYLRDENEFQLGYDYAEIVRRKGLESRHSHLLAKLQKFQDASDFKNSKHYSQQLLLENAVHELECYYNQKRGDLNVPRLLQVLEVNYNIQRLSVLNRFLLQQKTSKIEVPEYIKAQLEGNWLPVNHLEDSAVLRSNNAILNLLKKEQPDPSDVRLLFTLLQQEEKNLDQENLQEFYTYLRNICILVLSSDIDNFELEKTLNELYKDNLLRGYLHYEGKLHPSRYWAVSSNAIRAKDYAWAIKFIEDYKNDLIGENDSHDIYRLNLANYLFSVGRFSECLDNIPGSSPFVDYMLTGKRIELKAYYELNSELLSYKLEAFKVFLSRTSPKLLSDAQKQFHLDFANLLTQIFVSIPGDPKRSELLTKRIQERKQAAEWRWLLEKAKALKGK